MSITSRRYAESVRRVVVAVAEEQADEAVRQPVDDELDAWIVVDGAAAHEARPESAVVTLLEQLEIPHEVGRVVRGVGHDDGDGVALELVEPDRTVNPKPRGRWEAW